MEHTNENCPAMYKTAAECICKPMFTEGKWELNEVQPWEIWVGADKHIASVHGQQQVRSANARRIVQCCNSHDELVEALEDMIVNLEYCLSNHPAEDTEIPVLRACIEKAEQAFANAAKS